MTRWGLLFDRLIERYIRIRHDGPASIETYPGQNLSVSQLFHAVKKKLRGTSCAGQQLKINVTRNLLTENLTGWRP